MPAEPRWLFVLVLKLINIQHFGQSGHLASVWRREGLGW